MYGGLSFQNSCILSYDLIIQDDFTALGMVGKPKLCTTSPHLNCMIEFSSCREWRRF